METIRPVVSTEPDLEIRLARPEDLPAILEMLRRDSIPGTGSAEVSLDDQRRAFDKIASHPDNELIVATIGNEVVATLQLTFIPGLSYGGAWRAQVEGVRVRGDVRNRQVGTKLMNWVIDRARQRGCRLVQLTTNSARTDAQRFYARLGFKPSHVGMKLLL